MSRESHEASFYCSECGVSMATRKQLKKHQRCHKTISEKLTSGTVRRVSSVAAGSASTKYDLEIPIILNSLVRIKYYLMHRSV